MQSIELQCRLTALGLESQHRAAKVFNVRPTSVSRWLNGQTPIPDTIGEEIAELEDMVDDLAERMANWIESGLATDLVVHADDETFWAAHPEMDGHPAVFQQVAAARALTLLREDGIMVSILPAVIP